MSLLLRSHGGRFGGRVALAGANGDASGRVPRSCFRCSLDRTPDDRRLPVRPHCRPRRAPSPRCSLSPSSPPSRRSCRNACTGPWHRTWAHCPRRVAPPRRRDDCEGEPKIEGYVSTWRIATAPQLTGLSAKGSTRLAAKVSTPRRAVVALCAEEVREPAPAQLHLAFAQQAAPHVARPARTLG
jgi:hypothetical protein